MDADRLARGRTRALARLGFLLARRAPMAGGGIAVAVLTVGLSWLAAAWFAARDATFALGQLPGMTAGALAWGAGILLAFVATMGALQRDQREGIRELVRARGGSTNDYLLGRALGLALWLGCVVGGGSLLAAVGHLAMTSKLAVAGVLLGAAFGAMVYSAAFAVTVTPIFIAALGARSRVGGYGLILAVLLVPELVATVLSDELGTEWVSVLSLPGALGALRTALTPPHLDVEAAVRALVVLFGFAGLGAVAARAEVQRVEPGDRG